MIGDERSALRRRPDRLHLSVLVSSTGRPTAVAQLLDCLRGQTRPPDSVVLSVAGPQDLPPPEALAPGVMITTGAAGLPAQRNRGLDRVRDLADVVVLFDDDYLPSRRALEGIERLFLDHPDVVGADGLVLADGVTSGGIGYEAAKALLAAHDAGGPDVGGIVGERDHLYGCNMACRVAALGACRFDENLPLSAWQEDVDFAARLSAQGRIVQTRAFAGVHRGITQGRQSGRRTGYAQIANPIYLMRKGTMRPAHGARLIAKNLAINLVRACCPEPYVDRRGRALGNLLALIDVLRRKGHPSRILEL